MEGREMTYCPCCGRPYTLGVRPMPGPPGYHNMQGWLPTLWGPPTFWPAPPAYNTTSAGWTHLWLSQQPLESPQESYNKYVRALREMEAALARYPSGWSEPASEWDKIP